MEKLSKNLFLAVIACLLISLNYVSALGCPEKCSCQQRTVRCVRAQLKTIPEIPLDTNILDLRYNHIKEIPSDAFKGLTRLHSIFLNENQITSIHSAAFKGLSSLLYLYLNQNRIQTIASDAFVNLTKLERLNLYGNRIQRIPFGMFDNMNSLKSLRLDSNLLECDCDMMWLVQYFQTTKKQLVAAANCKSPDLMEGKNLLDLTEVDFHCKKPEILQDPLDLEVALGELAVLKCDADGDPTPDIEWIFNTNKIDSNDARIRVLADGTLQIDKIETRDQGSYHCVAKNSVGESTSREAHMTVREVSSTAASKSQHLPTSAAQMFYDEEDDYVMMLCPMDGIAKREIVWMHNDQIISDVTGHINTHVNGTIVIHNPIEEDEGNYRCEVKNTFGDLTTIANYDLIVPFITISPENQRVKIGESVLLSCNAEGNPEPVLTWTKDEGAVKYTNRVRLSSNNRTLNIDFIKESDSGLYACSAENILGSDEATAQVDVINSHGPPNLIFEPFDLDAIPGTTIELPCGAEGDPPPISKWKKDGRTLTKSIKYNLSPTGSLFISNINEFDAGRYECTVNNEYGRATASCVVSVRKREELAPGDKFVRIAFSEASVEVDNAINQTVASLFQPHENTTTSSPRDYGDLFRLVRFPTGPARELARASEIYERTLVNIRKHINGGRNMTANISTNFDYDDILSTEYLELLAQLSDCAAHRVTPNCTDMCYHSKYRTIDGSCNNFHNTLWGSSLSAFRRLLPSKYENSFNSPIGWNKTRKYNGFSLPSARLISTSLISTDVIEQDTEITHMVMQWGQFLDHDLDHALPAVSAESWDGVDCKKTCDFSPPCYPIEVPENDVRINNRRCIDFIRSSSTCGSGLTSIFFGKIQPREQINQLTSFIDASQVYGFSEQFSRDLRNISLEGEDNGYMREGVQFPNQKPLLPFASPTDGIDCRRDLDESSVNCLTAGDIRVNEQVGLLSMHVIWMREHNRIAKFFNEINPHWTGEQVYQEARKIVGAMMQHITFKHWLPYIIGDEGMELMGTYQGYNPSINPSISNEFATAALRFGHSLINPILHRLDWNFEPIPQGHLPLHKAFFAPWRVVYEGGVDPLLRGLFTAPAKLKKADQNLNSELTERLFTTFHAVSLDLAAMNIQRGRDHAIPSYMSYRKICNLTTSDNFEGLVDITNSGVRDKLKQLYGHPDNIDLWVGGILEDQIPGARVGPLFRCILIEQFKNLRDGDRFYYENPSIFTTEQLAEIKQAKLAQVMCNNGDNITRVTENSFILPSLQGGYKNCNEIPMMSLRVWTDCSECSRRTAYNLDIRSFPRRTRRDVKMMTENEGNSIEHDNESEVHFNIDNDFYDMNEERIEGLEQLVENFQRTLKKMRKEMRRLKNSNEDLLKSINFNMTNLGQTSQIEMNNDGGIKSPKHHYQCTDGKGISRMNNEIWMEDDCTNCICQHHQITCTIEKCSDEPPKCKKGLVLGKRNGQCCPNCIEEKQDQIDDTTIMSKVTRNR